MPQLISEIISAVKQNNGIIVGSYALSIFNPMQTFNDIDIIHPNPNKLSGNIVIKLNKKYEQDRFKVIKSYNAFRIYDNQNGEYIVDVARYPIKNGEYVNVNGLKVARPEFVLRGKGKQQVGRKIFRSVGIPKVDIRKFL